MQERSAAAVACPNIAFIKYWGNRNPSLNLPASGSISMNLDPLQTRSTVTFCPEKEHDSLTINGKLASQMALKRVTQFLDHVRVQAGISLWAQVESHNNFPSGAGIASSASAFASLSLAASRAAGLDLTEDQLSRLARLGSGSACRSVPSGFVEWLPGSGDQDSYAISLAPPDHWNLVDCIAIVSEGHKHTGSREGHTLAGTSPLQQARLQGTSQRLDTCRRAILERDFDALAAVTEADSNLMHAVMMTSTPPLFYWQPATIAILQAVPEWRRSGLPVFFTVDAGPNVHVFTQHETAAVVSARLTGMEGVKRVLTAGPGDGVKLF